VSGPLRQPPEDFIRANTRLEAPPLVPEVQLHLASEVVPLWEATEEELAAKGLPPPFWAFAWAGGQALARYLLDHPEVVRGKRVLDFAAGSGLQGIAALKAGAAAVEAVEIDAFACAACRLNAEANGVALTVREADIVGSANPGWDVVLAGDICYERPAAERISAWLRGLATPECLVLMGDPGRTYLPRQGLERIIAYGVKTSRELEDSDLRNAVVWRVSPLPETS
jgi:predicted nicotinamide N-methyase